MDKIKICHLLQGGFRAKRAKFYKRAKKLWQRNLRTWRTRQPKLQRGYQSWCKWHLLYESCNELRYRAYKKDNREQKLLNLV